MFTAAACLRTLMFEADKFKPLSEKEIFAATRIYKRYNYQLKKYD